MKKIMFDDKYGLERAVLNETKTCTRRLVPEKYRKNKTPDVLDNLQMLIKHARYHVNETVAIAQPYSTVYDSIKNSSLPDRNKDLLAKYEQLRSDEGWLNKMYVKAEYMLHIIRITNIRVEHLRDITYDDCFREGVYRDDLNGKKIGPFNYCFTCDGLYSKRNKQKLYSCHPKVIFAELINRLSHRDIWNENPLVFVYNFKLIV